MFALKLLNQYLFKMSKKIVVIGPESTGKTILCQKLALHYKVEWIPEYARKYIENLKT